MEGGGSCSRREREDIPNCKLVEELMQMSVFCLYSWE